MRKSAKLRRNRAPPKEHRANYDLFSIERNALENIIRNRERPRSRDRDNNVIMQEEENKESPRRERWVVYPRLDLNQIRREDDNYSV